MADWLKEAVEIKPTAQKKASWMDDAVEVSQEDVNGGGLLRGAVKALPAAGSVVGGILGSELGPLGIAGGGALGGMGGRALQQTIEEQLYNEQKTPLEKAKEIGYEGLLDAAGGAIAGPISKGLSATKNFIASPAKAVLRQVGRFNQVPKEAAPEILAAAERLGTKATPGMLTENKLIQGLESNMAQSPTEVGLSYKKNYDDVQKALEGGAEGLLSPYTSQGKTPMELASESKGLIEQEIENRFKNSKQIFENLHQDGKLVPVNEITRKKIASNIENLPYAKIEGTDASSFANKISANLRKNETLSDLRNLKSYVGDVSRDRAASPALRNTAGEIYSRLAQAEKNSITKATVDYMKTTRGGGFGQMIAEDEGKEVAKQMLSDLKVANKEYATISGELKDIAKKSNMGNVRNYADFVYKLNEMPIEKLNQKLFNTSNIAQLRSVQKTFPGAFDKMKQAYMTDLYEKSIVKDEVSIPKLLSNVRKLQPETRNLLFGDDAVKTMVDIETVYNAFPRRMGPSGTPEGMEFNDFSVVSPKTWWKELRDKANDLAIKNPQWFERFAPKQQSPLIQQSLKNKQILLPQIPRAFGYNQNE